MMQDLYHQQYDGSRQGLIRVQKDRRPQPERNLQLHVGWVGKFFGALFGHSRAQLLKNEDARARGLGFRVCPFSFAE